MRQERLGDDGVSNGAAHLGSGSGCAGREGDLGEANVQLQNLTGRVLSDS